MSRRDQNRTDDSIAESPKELLLTGVRYTGELVGYNQFAANDMRNAKPEVILQRMLSTKSYISTTSSNAIENQQAADDISQRKFKHIGEGQCGIAYALIGTNEVLKIAKSGKEEALWNDLQMHNLVQEAFKESPISLRQNIALPNASKWVLPVDLVFWESYLEYFNDTFERTYGLVSSRIYALPFPVRAALFDTFAPSAIKNNRAAELAKYENKDCLVRPYLGRRLGKDNRPTFRLRNFPLHVDDMEKLKLDTHLYAKIMAQALAILHWKAGVDANDIEFVFGSTPKLKALPSAKETFDSNMDDFKFLGEDLDFTHRSVSIWLLDFNMCAKISREQNDLKKMINGFMWNDPYYPRPSSNSADQKLWETFKKEYVAASSKLGYKDDGARFMEGVEKECKKKSAGFGF
jgi:hypothetical protein